MVAARGVPNDLHQCLDRKTLRNTWEVDCGVTTTPPCFFQIHRHGVFWYITTKVSCSYFQHVHIEATHVHTAIYAFLAWLSSKLVPCLLVYPILHFSRVSLAGHQNPCWLGQHGSSLRIFNPAWTLGGLVHYWSLELYKPLQSSGFGSIRVTPSHGLPCRFQPLETLYPRDPKHVYYRPLLHRPFKNQ